MKEIRNCSLIKDLLPSYIDGMSTEETNDFIIEHLQDCNKCRESYENMKTNLNFTEHNENKKKIKIFKKINRKIRTLQIIILIIIIILLGIFIRKFIIFNKIETMAENINYNNYYERIVETTDTVSNRIEYYQNGDNFFMVQIKINNINNEISKSTEYRYDGNEYYYSEINGQKLVTEGKRTVEPLVQFQFLNKSIFGNIGLALMPGSLKETSLYKKDCYLLNVENYLNFIDKKTGLTVKEINIANNSVIDYEYSFNSVNDSKIIELIEQHKEQKRTLITLYLLKTF